jgi:hypothetical protein
MIHHLFRALANLVPHAHKVVKHTAVLAPTTWLHSGKATQHTSKFITKQAGKGFKFPK